MTAQYPERPKETDDWEKQKEPEERQQDEEQQETMQWEDDKSPESE